MASRENLAVQLRDDLKGIRSGGIDDKPPVSRLAAHGNDNSLAGHCSTRPEYEQQRKTDQVRHKPSVHSSAPKPRTKATVYLLGKSGMTVTMRTILSKLLNGTTQDCPILVTAPLSPSISLANSEH